MHDRTADSWNAPMSASAELRVYHWLVAQGEARSTYEVAVALCISSRTARRRLRRLFGHRYIRPAGFTATGQHCWEALPLDEVSLPTVADCSQSLRIR